MTYWVIYLNMGERLFISSPPNHFVFVRLSPTFTSLDLNVAHLFTAKSKSHLIADPLGASACELNVLKKRQYLDVPYDLLVH